MLDCQKPKKKRQLAIEYPEGPDGRQVCNLKTTEGRRIYRVSTWAMWTRQGDRCAMCRFALAYPTFDHEAGRGAGKRDDRILVDGKWQNAALCVTCNGLKGSKRYRWINGQYLPTKRLQEVA